MCGCVLTFPSFYPLPCSVLCWLCCFHVLGLCLDLWACDLSLLALRNLSLYLDWGPCSPGWASAWNSIGDLVFCLLFLRAPVLFGRCGLKRWFAHWPQKGSSAPSQAQENFFLTTIISHGFIFCHSCVFFTDIAFVFLPGSTSVCYKPTSPVQVLEDTAFLYQDHQLFAGRHEVSPLTAEVISAKEKAGKCMAVLLYEPTALTSRFFPRHK